MRGTYDGKYGALNRYLRDREPPAVTMQFAEIEAILSDQLPESARKHQAWWANQDRGQSLAWMRAGYRTSDLNIREGVVTFVREDQIVTDTEASASHEGATLDPLSIAEAKFRLAQTLGVDPSQIEITIRA